MSQSIPVYLIYNHVSYPPLALGMIVAYAKSYKASALEASYEFVPTLLSSVDLAREVVGKRGPGVFLCSDYMWSIRENLEISRVVKEIHPQSITIHGGPSVPKYDYSCEAFLQQHAYADIAVRGEGEVVVAEILEELAGRGDWNCDRSFLSGVRGITFRTTLDCETGAKVYRTVDRERVVDLDTLPSPYLTNWFGSTEASKWWGGAILETNRGCPYGCTFCDWGAATLSKVRQFSLERVQQELEWIAEHQIEVLWIADANWGIFSRDVKVAETIAACKRAYGYPKSVIVNYAKHGTERIAELVRILRAAEVAAGGIISIQTQDPGTLQIINRSNINTKRYEELIDVFRKQNLPVSSDLMMGLPGSTIESFKADIQFFFDRKVFAQIYNTFVLPNSPMAERGYMEKYGIKTDEMGEILSTFSYTEEERAKMARTAVTYKYVVGCSIGNYLSYYLQVDHGVRMIDFVEALATQWSEHPLSLPNTLLLIELLKSQDQRLQLLRRSLGQWRLFYREIEEFITRKFGISDASMGSVLTLQASLMPRLDRPLPETIEMPHDVASYFVAMRQVGNLSELKQNSFKTLATYPPGRIQISDPMGLCQGAIDSVRDSHHELACELTWVAAGDLRCGEEADWAPLAG